MPLCYTAWCSDPRGRGRGGHGLWQEQGKGRGRKICSSVQAALPDSSPQ